MLKHMKSCQIIAHLYTIFWGEHSGCRHHGSARHTTQRKVKSYGMGCLSCAVLVVH
jgi:hypothetical protein